MTSVSEGKRAVVVADSDLLFKAIEWNLSRRLDVEVVRVVPNPSEPPGARIERDKFDLIVVALSAPAGEPVVDLMRTSLIDRLGQVPLLIISDRPFEPRLGDKIAYLRFPFTPDELCVQVTELLARQEAVV